MKSMIDVAKLKGAVTVDKEIMSGEPVFAGTRVPLRNLFEVLEEGGSVDEFLRDFYWVKREHVLAVLSASGQDVIQTLKDRETAA